MLGSAESLNFIPRKLLVSSKCSLFVLFADLIIPVAVFIQCVF